MKANRIPFTSAQLHELLEEREPGVLYWREVGRGHPDVNKPAGAVIRHGYVQITLNYKAYLRHRLVWLMHKGHQPCRLDHRNGIPGDDRMENLQVATQSKNMWKRKRGRNNTSGYTGVYPTPSGRYSACIAAHGKQYHLGTFDTAEQANDAYLEAKKVLHEGVANVEPATKIGA